MPGTGEFDLIGRIRARCRDRDDVLLGIGDDGAVLAPPPGEALVVAVDTLNAGIHFPEGTAPADIGHKALAVNLSDLAAMGARPLWCTLSLCLPGSDADWVDAFLDGFLALASEHELALVGGDTTRGPLSISVTVIGAVPAGEALRRDGACAGDDVWVSGCVGDAAAGLLVAQRPDAGQARDDDATLRARLDRPTPRVALGRRLRGLASAAIDVSDGLLADLGHVAAASGVAADIELAELPTSPALAATVPVPGRWTLQVSGGDDYELCLTAAPDRREALAALSRELGLELTRIGQVRDGSGVVLVDPEGRPWHSARPGHDHFAGTPG